MHVSSHIPCVVLAYSMLGTGIFHAWYRRIPYMILAYSMRGTGVCVPCMVQGIPMHTPCTVQAAAPYNKHIYRFCTRHTVLLVKSKGKYTLLKHALTVTGKWTKLVGRIGCKFCLHINCIRSLSKGTQP